MAAKKVKLTVRCHAATARHHQLAHLFDVMFQLTACYVSVIVLRQADDWLHIASDVPYLYSVARVYVLVRWCLCIRTLTFVYSYADVCVLIRLRPVIASSTSSARRPSTRRAPASATCARSDCAPWSMTTTSLKVKARLPFTCVLFCLQAWRYSIWRQTYITRKETRCPFVHVGYSSFRSQ